MINAIFFLQLVNIPNESMPAGTIVNIYSMEEINKLEGGDLGMFIPIKISTSLYTFEELLQLQWVKGCVFSKCGISEEELAERINILVNLAIEQINQVFIRPNQVKAPDFENIVNIDEPGVLFDTYYTPSE